MKQRSHLVPLPECEGPRLHPFKARRQEPDIEFLEHLGTGLTAHVFKAKVDDRIVVLKIFKHTYGYVRVDDEYRDKLDTHLVEAHTHPFYAECRAYARLKELDKEHLAVHCHGYFFLSEAQENALEQSLGTFDWTEESLTEKRSGQPLQVIVKDYIPGKQYYGPEHARRMLRELKELHRCGILVMDIKEDAYVNGILVDFSHAITIPHIKFDPALGFDPYREGQECAWTDLGNLDGMFWDWNQDAENNRKIDVRVTPDWHKVCRLRNKKENPFANIEDYKFFDPTKFNWRKQRQPKGQRKPSAAAGKATNVKTRHRNGRKSTRGQGARGKGTRRKLLP